MSALYCALRLCLSLPLTHTIILNLLVLKIHRHSPFPTLTLQADPFWHSVFTREVLFGSWLTGTEAQRDHWHLGGVSCLQVCSLGDMVGLLSTNFNVPVPTEGRWTLWRRKVSLFLHAVICFLCYQSLMRRLFQSSF